MDQKRVLLIMGSRYIDRVHRGVAQYAGRRHWHLTNLFGEDPNLVRGRECDGIIAALGESDLLSDAILGQKQPIVSVTMARERLKLPHITGDNEAMGRTAAKHFLERGFRRFVWYTETGERAAKRRLLGYRAALQEAGCDCVILDRTKAFPGSPPRWRELSSWLQQSIRGIGLPCATYAFNDSQAVNFLDACLGGGFRVPDEVAVLGTDNHSLICPTAAVPLSSINHDLEALGQRAAEVLDSLMAGGARRRQLIEIPHQGITVRQSSDAFAVNDPELVSALRFIYDNFQRSIGVEQIAAVTGLSRRALERRFQQALQTSVLAKLNGLRLDHACRMLRASELPIVEIAARSGYSTPEYFHRVFREKLGTTPRQYRLGQ
jgi:LacI family transcriptional regulator